MTTTHELCNVFAAALGIERDVVLDHARHLHEAGGRFTEGLRAPKTRRGAAAITRLTVFIKALAEEHTSDPVAAGKSPK